MSPGGRYPLSRGGVFRWCSFDAERFDSRELSGRRAPTWGSPWLGSRRRDPGSGGCTIQPPRIAPAEASVREQPDDQATHDALATALALPGTPRRGPVSHEGRPGDRTRPWSRHLELAMVDGLATASARRGPRLRPPASRCQPLGRAVPACRWPRSSSEATAGAGRRRLATGHRRLPRRPRLDPTNLEAPRLLMVGGARPATLPWPATTRICLGFDPPDAGLLRRLLEGLPDPRLPVVTRWPEIVRPGGESLTRRRPASPRYRPAGTTGTPRPGRPQSVFRMFSIFAAGVPRPVR